MSDPFRRSSSPVVSTPGTPGAGTNIGGTALSSLDFSSARSDITDVMAGRVTLAMLDLIILGIIGFWLATKSAQGGA